MVNVPNVSILISSYNRADSIGACLNACINQTVTDIEILVVDYGSDDATLSIVNNYVGLDSRVRLFQREPQVFYSSAGREYAQSEYVLFLSPSAVIPGDLLSVLLDGFGEEKAWTDYLGFTLYKINSEQYANRCLIDTAISCITPAYNAAEYLAECLNSVVVQSLFNIESLCVDDGSTDGTLSLIESFAFRDTRIHFAENGHKGAAESRNLALRHANGECIYFLDADDYIPDSDIFKLLYHTAKQENVLVCGGGFSEYDGSELRTEFTGVLKGYVFNDNAKIRYSDYQFDFGFTRFVYNRKLIINNGLFFPDRSYYEDPVWFVRIMEIAKEFYGINKVTYCYRSNHKPFSPAVFSEKNISDLTTGMAEILEIATRHGWEKLIDLTCMRYLNDYAPFVYPKLSLDRPDIIEKVERFGRVSGLSGSLAMYRMSRRYMDELIWRNEENDLHRQEEIDRLRNEITSKNDVMADGTRQIADLRQELTRQEIRLADLSEQVRISVDDRDRILADYNLLKVKYNHQLPVRIKNGIRYVRNRHSDRNRIVLQLRDRLGNQMFIYALYMKLKSMGRDVTIDDTSMIAECENGRVFDNTDLIRTFGITYDRASDHQIEALRDTGTHKSDRLRRRLLGAQGIICTESKDFAYDETLLKTRKGYFEGYFQNTRYFSDIESEIRKAFQFHPIPNSNTAAIDVEQQIRSAKNAVSIHLRFGDYLSDINSKLYGGICTDQYYAKCLELIRQTTSEGLSCFVFSDDTERANQWLQLNSHLFNGDDTVAIVNVCENYLDNWIDMYLMSLCKYNIIANTTFSFWASYLNVRQDKVVYGPKFWIRREDTLIQGVRTDDMILVDPVGNSEDD